MTVLQELPARTGRAFAASVASSSSSSSSSSSPLSGIARPAAAPTPNPTTTTTNRRTRWIQIDEDISMLDSSPSAPPLNLVLHQLHASVSASSSVSVSSNNPPPFNPYWEPPPAYHELYPSVPGQVDPAAPYPVPVQQRQLTKEEQEREDELFVRELVAREALLGREMEGPEASAPEPVEPTMHVPGSGSSGARIWDLDEDGNAGTELRRIDSRNQFAGDANAVVARTGANEQLVATAGEQPRTFNPAYPVSVSISEMFNSLFAAIPDIHNAYIGTVLAAPGWVAGFWTTQGAAGEQAAPTAATGRHHIARDPRAVRQDQLVPNNDNFEEDWEFIRPAAPHEREAPFGHYACRRCIDSPGRVSPRTYLSPILPSFATSLLPAWEWTCPSCSGTGFRRKWWYAAGQTAVKVGTKAAKVATRGVVVAGGWYLLREAASVGGVGAGVAAAPVVVWMVKGVGKVVREW